MLAFMCLLVCIAHCCMPLFTRVSLSVKRGEPWGHTGGESGGKQLKHSVPADRMSAGVRLASWPRHSGPNENHPRAQCSPRDHSSTRGAFPLQTARKRIANHQTVAKPQNVVGVEWVTGQQVEGWNGHGGRHEVQGSRSFYSKGSVAGQGQARRGHCGVHVDGVSCRFRHCMVGKSSVRHAQPPSSIGKWRLYLFGLENTRRLFAMQPLPGLQHSGLSGAVGGGGCSGGQTSCRSPNALCLARL